METKRFSAILPSRWGLSEQKTMVAVKGHKNDILDFATQNDTLQLAKTLKKINSQHNSFTQNGTQSCVPFWVKVLCCELLCAVSYFFSFVTNCTVSFCFVKSEVLWVENLKDAPRSLTWCDKRRISPACTPWGTTLCKKAKPVVSICISSARPPVRSIEKVLKPRLMEGSPGTLTKTTLKFCWTEHLLQSLWLSWFNTIGIHVIYLCHSLF